MAEVEYQPTHYRAKIVKMDDGGYVTEIWLCEWVFDKGKEYCLYSEVVNQRPFAKRKDALKDLKKRGFKYGESIFGGHWWFWGA